MVETVSKMKDMQKIGISLDKMGASITKEQSLKLPTPNLSGNIPEKTEADPLRGTRFTVFAMAFSTLGLLAITFSGVPVAGNIVVADLVLGSALVCLSTSLYRSIISNRRKGFKLPFSFFGKKSI
jgi:hypothetical protein